MKVARKEDYSYKFAIYNFGHSAYLLRLFCTAQDTWEKKKINLPTRKHGGGQRSSVDKCTMRRRRAYGRLCYHGLENMCRNCEREELVRVF